MNDDAEWIEHNYLYTYQIANRVQALAQNPDLHYLEALTLDSGIADFLPHWQRDTALHKFIRYIADDMLESDNCGRHRIQFGDDYLNPRWTLPIEVALVSYGVSHEIAFEVPDIPPVKTRRGNITHVEDAPELLDACYEHFWYLRLTQAYDDLLHRLADEVFYVMFMNRSVLQSLHEYLAYYVTEAYVDSITEEYPNLARYYTNSGRIRRTNIPKWVRRAVFFRDRGLCVMCRKNISGVIDRFGIENYDHIVPLAEGGLNCVTNLQLLCESCNKEKSARRILVSKAYQRWY